MSYGATIKSVDLWKKIQKELELKPNLILTLRHIKSHQVDKCKDKEQKKLLLKDRHIYGNTVADRLADYKRHNNYLEDLETWAFENKEY